MLSRARKLDNLILVGLTARIKALLEAGPPEYIREQLNDLQDKTKIWETENEGRITRLMNGEATV